MLQKSKCAGATDYRNPTVRLSRFITQRKVHLPDFKAKVGLEALRGVKTINEIGQEFGIHPEQVSQWKKEIQEQAKTLFEGRRGPVTFPLFFVFQGTSFMLPVFPGVAH